MFLRGQNFSDGMEVRVADTLAQAVTVISPEEMMITLPARPGAFGAVPISLTRRDRESVTRDDLFAFSGSLLTLPVDGGSADLVSADFDGDGQRDLAYVRTAEMSDEIFILPGTGGGHFGAAVAVSTGGVASKLEVADFDGDGLPDLLVTTQSYPAIVLRNAGKLNFAPVAKLPAVANRQSMAGDFNGDGRPDIVILPTANAMGPSTGSLLINSGAGTFGPEVSFSTPADCRRGTAADFNKDGKQDLAVTGKDVVAIYLSGPAGFSAPLMVSLTNPVALAAGDLDSDGTVDLAVVTAADRSADINVLRGDGSGGFKPAARIATEPNTYAILTGDFNGDTHLDLIVGRYEFGQLSILLGTGTGSFGPAMKYQVGNGVSAIVLADLDGDANPDLASGALLGGSISLLLSRDLGGFAPPLSFPAGNGTDAVIAADFDGDSHIDVAVASQWSGNVVSVLQGDGRGRLGPATDYSLAVGIALPPVQGPAPLLAGDANGDGRADLLMALVSPEPRLGVMLNKGAGGFDPPLLARTVRFGYSIAFAAADFNIDGKLDVVFTLQDGLPMKQLGFLPGDGAGGFGTLEQVAAGFDASFLVPADFNGDGVPDLVCINRDLPQISILMGKGRAGFEAPKLVPAPTSSEITAAHATDLNGDGRADLVLTFRKYPGARAAVLLGHGDGTFGPPTTYLVIGAPSAITAGDVNGDRLVDLVLADQGGNSVNVLLGSGGGAFSTPTGFQVDGNPRAVALADMNGDGKLDIVVPNETTNRVSVLLNRY